MKAGLNYSSADQRRALQLAFTNGSENVIVGLVDDLPLPLNELLVLNEGSDCVVQCHKNGLTSTVYKIMQDDKFFTVKIKRPVAGVKNIDGETSFLNEVQRRHDFHALKKSQPDSFANIVDTVYADFRAGIIVSHWIEGEEIVLYDDDIFRSMFTTLLEMEKNGIFEYDLISGNFLLDEKREVKFYDFGYCYRFNPLTEFNPDGLAIPLFDHVERFETRAFFAHLADIEQYRSIDLALRLYRSEKTMAHTFYAEKLSWLITNKADHVIVEKVQGAKDLINEALTNDDALLALYRKEKFRSYLIDVHDDISGKSCTPDTLIKADYVLQTCHSDYKFLVTNNALFWGDENLSKDQLLQQYGDYKSKAKQYQSLDLSGYNAWLQQRISNLDAYK